MPAPTGRALPSTPALQVLSRAGQVHAPPHLPPSRAAKKPERGRVHSPNPQTGRLRARVRGLLGGGAGGSAAGGSALDAPGSLLSAAFHLGLLVGVPFSPHGCVHKLATCSAGSCLPGQDYDTGEL